MGKNYRNYSKTSSTPRRPFEKERIDSELVQIGKFGLKNKREVWRVQLTLAKIRKAARELLKLEEKDPKRLFEGAALLRRMVRYGLLSESEKKAGLCFRTNPYQVPRAKTPNQNLQVGRYGQIHPPCKMPDQAKTHQSRKGSSHRSPVHGES